MISVDVIACTLKESETGNPDTTRTDRTQGLVGVQAIASVGDGLGGLSVHRITRRSDGSYSQSPTDALGSEDTRKRYILEGPPPPEHLGCRPVSEMKYVCACASNAWTVASWHLGAPAIKHFRPFRCRSWRHPGECQRWKGAQDFVRIRDAVASRSNWFFVVLTFDPSREVSEWNAYRNGGRKWDTLRKRMQRDLRDDVEYIQTWERTRKGWPHVNLLISSESLAKRCSIVGCDHHGAGDAAFRLCEGFAAYRQELKRDAVACGFGQVIWFEPLHSAERIAGYLVKKASELTGGGKEYQIPVDAPKNFRRLRASRGLLPPVHNGDEDWTGEMIQKNVETVERECRLAAEDARIDAEFQSWRSAVVVNVRAEEKYAAELTRALATFRDLEFNSARLTEFEYQLIDEAYRVERPPEIIPYDEQGIQWRN